MHMWTRYRHWIAIAAVLIVATMLTSCGIRIVIATTPTPPPPTPTPKLRPTFTPTPTPAQGTQAQATGQVVPIETPTPVPTPTDTPTPMPPAAVPNTNMNVRAGPGTNYPIIGAARAGQTFLITGKNPQGDWWQIDYNGRTGWLYAPLTVPQGDVSQIQVAANIPTPPPPTPTPIPTPTPPPAPPQPQYEYNKALVQRCDPNAGATYVNGTVYRNHQPFNGARVVYSYEPDGPWVTAPVISGPHTGYPNWAPGFYSHIIGANGPRGGEWYFWIVDESGKRISAIAHLHTDSTAGDGKCQQAIIDFDTN
ncbi:MAG: hypothetical protein Kow0047_13190 [Anaerolineae bacterium]